MRRFLGSFLLGAVMAMPVVMRADDEHERHEANRTERYYDKDAKSYHEWNDQEERAYRHWWGESHHNAAAREWNKLSDRERQQYWRWRHQHPEAY